jgi:hypothetical protein
MEEPVLDEMLDLRLDVRTVVVALRRRRKGLPAPKPGEKWAVGRWVRHIEQNWDDPNFKLASVYPWIPQAREYLDEGKAVDLERLQFNIIWSGLDRLKDNAYFGFDVVLAYLFQWDMMQRWLAYDVEKAGERFDELVAEALNGHEKLFEG